VSPLERPTPPGGRAAEDELLATGWVTYEFSRRCVIDSAIHLYRCLTCTETVTADEAGAIEVIVDAAFWGEVGDDSDDINDHESARIDRLVERYLRANFPPAPIVPATDAELAEMQVYDVLGNRIDLVALRAERQAVAA
jgi:hypothetical protein